MNNKTLAKMMLENSSLLTLQRQHIIICLKKLDSVLSCSLQYVTFSPHLWRWISYILGSGFHSARQYYSQP